MSDDFAPGVAARPRRSIVIRVAVALLVTVAFAFAVRAVAARWDDVRGTLGTLDPRWPLVAASCVVVGLVYAILIESWRLLLRGAGARLRYGDAARIWLVSNLGRYVPGKVWQLTAMAAMSRRLGASGVAAGGAAIVSTIVTLVAGGAVALLTGSRALELSRAAVVALGVLSLAVLASAPFLRRLAVVAARVTGRDVSIPSFPPADIVRSTLASVVAWLLYGAAFWLFARGLLPNLHLDWATATSVFVASYLAGFLAIFAPGGAGVRELAMAAALHRVGVGSGDAIVLVVTSRLWLTVLEITPAVALLPFAGQRPPIEPPAGPR